MKSLRLSSTNTELKHQFHSLQTRTDIACMLEVEESALIYYLYRKAKSSLYTEFEIAKRGGGTRKIMAPTSSIKLIQRKLNQVLQAVYEPKITVHGFIQSRSVVTNALPHIRKRYVLNIDLKDFFTTINFGRVRGMFMAPPYGLNSEVSTILAQICCHNNCLPQGAPTSPIISNMICRKMDSQLKSLATNNRCAYSRYADDITFSTNARTFPKTIARQEQISSEWIIGYLLKGIIAENGFEVNYDKFRMQTHLERQEVTGVVVNRKVNLRRTYIRQIRAMLHAWEKFGLEAAAHEHHSKYRIGEELEGSGEDFFKNVVRGKIEYLGMVRGEQDPLYQKCLQKLDALAPGIVNPNKITSTLRDNYQNTIPIIYTEGKTDWKHIKWAYQKLREKGDITYEIQFHESEIDMGGTQLKTMCEKHAQGVGPRQMEVFIFDNDDSKVAKDVQEDANGYKDWGNQVYSMTLPIPSHRSHTPEISIEFYYQDSEIMRTDEDGRRLYLSDEFNSQSGRHNNQDLVCRSPKINAPHISIIDEKVFNIGNTNVALTKSNFAAHITNGAKNFDDFDPTPFAQIFDVIERIIQVKSGGKVMK